MSTLTLHLPEREAAVLKQLAEEQGMTQTAILRQALRVYQLVHDRAQKGQQLAFTKDGVLVPVVLVGLLPPGI